MSGRNIKLSWTKPEDIVNSDFELLLFQVEHNFPNYDTPLEVSGDVLEYVFEDVPVGDYFTTVIGYDQFNKRSEPLTRRIQVLNDFSAEIPRFTLNVPIGGSSTTPLVINPDTGLIRFEKPSYTLTPKHPKAVETINTSLNPETFSQSAANMTAVSSLADLVISEDELLTAHNNFSYILHQPSEATDKLKLIKYQRAIPQGFGYTSARWYDAGNGNSLESLDYVTMTGSMVRKKNSSKVTGINTSFCSEIAVGDVFKAEVDRKFTFSPTANSFEAASKQFRFDDDLGFVELGTAVTYNPHQYHYHPDDLVKTETLGDLVKGNTYYLEPLPTGCSFNVAVHTTEAGALAGTTATRVSFTPNNDSFDMRAFDAAGVLSPQGIVNYIESAECLYLDNYENNFHASSNSLKRQGLRINRISDTIIAAVAKKPDGTFFLSSMLEKVAEDEGNIPPASVDSATPGKFVHYFPTNSTVNGKLTDTVGNATGVIEGSNFAISDDSIMGNSLSLSGSTGAKILIDSQADTWMQTTSSWSVAFWAKSEKDDSTNTDSTNDARLISRDRSEFFGLLMDQGASQEVHLDYRNGSSVSSVPVVSHTSKDEWHHYAITYDKTTLKVYIDGLFETSVTDYVPNYSLSRPLGLGANVETDVEETSPTSGAFVGKFTEIRLYTKALGEGEIIGLYSLPGASNDTAIKDNTTILGEGDQSLHIDEQGIYLGNDTVGNAPFSVTPEGAISATSGKIADWNLAASALFSGLTATTSGYSNSGITLAAQGSIHAPEFYIDETGSAFFKGEITASSGHIGGWQIRADGIHSSNLSFTSGENMPASGYLPSASGMVIHNQGSIHAHNFFVNSDGSAEFRGDISGATGTFSGAIGNQSIGADQIADGSITSSELAPESVTGFNISPEGTIAVFSKSSNGAVIPSSFAALDGADDLYRIYAGSNAAGNAPFRVTKTGKVVADNIQLFGSGSNIFFDSAAGGFTDAAVTQIAKRTATRVNAFSELFTGTKDSSDTSTFEEITLTETTDILTNLAVPVSTLSKTVSKEYYGNRSNPLFLTIDFQTIGATGTTSLDRVNHIKKSGFLASTSAVKVGEIVRINLVNCPAGMALTGVTGAKNAFSGSDFVLPTTISGPSSVNFILFEIDSSTEEFSFSISSATTSDISFVASGSGSTELSLAKPVTETDAQNAIPNSITFGLNYSTVSAEHATVVAVQANKTFSKYTGAGTPSNTQYKVGTLSKDVVDVDTIHTTVAVVAGGSVDDQGYLTHSATTTSLTASSYFFHSTLNVSGGDTDLQPTTRLFTASVADSATGFIIQPSGAATQTSQAGAFGNMVLNGDMTVGSSFSIDPDNVAGGGSGTVTIEGNLHVTGTQTSVNQTNLEITDKTLLLAANATTAAAINGAGIVVDRSGLQTGSEPNATFLWDQSNTEWKAYTCLTANSFKSAVDGSVSTPAYRFGSRSKTGIYASDTEGNDAKINIVTRDNSDNAHTSYFAPSGLHSSANIYTGDSSSFTNFGGVWLATTGTGDNGFQFRPNNSPTAVVEIQPSGTGNEALKVSNCAIHIATLETTKSSGRILSKATHRSGFFAENSQSSMNIGAFIADSSRGFTMLEGAGIGTVALSGTYGSVNPSIYVPFRSGYWADRSNKPGAIIQKAFQDTQPLSNQGPLPDTAQLVLYNSQADSATYPYARVMPSTLSFASSLSSTTVAETAMVQRGYISSGSDHTDRGYGYMEFGVQTKDVIDDDDNVINNSTPSRPVIYINHDSHVGINTVNPAADLDINGRSGGIASVQLEKTSTTNGGGDDAILQFKNTAGTDTAFTHLKMSNGGGDHQTTFTIRTKGKEEGGAQKDIVKINHLYGNIELGDNNSSTKSPRTAVVVGNTGIDSFQESISAGQAIDTSTTLFSKLVAYGDVFDFTIHVAGPGEDPFTSKITAMWDNTNSEVLATEYVVLIADGKTKTSSFTVEYDTGSLILKGINNTVGARTYTGSVQVLRS